MSPAAIVALVALVACGGAHLDAEGGSLELISSVSADSLVGLTLGQDVTSLPAIKGPGCIQDTSAAFGFGTYLDAANGINGKPAILLDRNDYPRLMFASPLHPTRENWLINVVHDPDTVNAVADTRGYLEGWTETVGEGTRLAYAQNGNTGDTPLNRLGVSLDDFNFEQPGMNRGWHRFYDERGVAALTIAGPQYATIVLTNIGLPMWFRNGALVGVGMPNQYIEPYRRAPSLKAVLWSDAPGAAPGSTAAFYNNKWRARELYKLTGQISVDQVLAIHLAFGAQHGF